MMYTHFVMNLAIFANIENQLGITMCASYVSENRTKHRAYR